MVQGSFWNLWKRIFEWKTTRTGASRVGIEAEEDYSLLLGFKDWLRKKRKIDVGDSSIDENPIKTERKSETFQWTDFAAYLRRGRNATMRQPSDQDNHHEPATPEHYIHHRLDKEIQYYKDRIPLYARSRNFCKTVLVIGSILGGKWKLYCSFFYVHLHLVFEKYCLV